MRATPACRSTWMIWSATVVLTGPTIRSLRSGSHWCADRSSGEDLLVLGLLERDDQLAALEAALASAERGDGGVALLAGQAGLGKTSVVRAFVRSASGRSRLLLGACDDLVSPRTLGPLRDAARSVGGPLAAALAGPDRDPVLTAVLDALSAPGRPTVLVVEDAHWA